MKKSTKSLAAIAGIAAAMGMTGQEMSDLRKTEATPKPATFPRKKWKKRKKRLVIAKKSKRLNRK